MLKKLRTMSLKRSWTSTLTTSASRAEAVSYNTHASSLSRVIPEKWLWICTVVVLLTVAAALRLGRLGALSLWGDEGLQALAVQSILTDGFPHIGNRLYLRGIPTLYAEALAAIFFGLSEFSLRLPSVLAGLATMVVTYCLGASLVNRRVGLVAAILVALSTWEIEFSRFARMYAVFQLSFTLSVWWLFEALFRARHKFLIPGILAAVLTVLSHWLGLLVLVPVGLALFWSGPIPTPRKRILAISGGIGAIWFLYYGPVYRVLANMLIPSSSQLASSHVSTAVPLKASTFFAPPLAMVKELYLSQPVAFLALLGAVTAVIVWLCVTMRTHGGSFGEVVLLSASVLLALFHQFGLVLASVLIYFVMFPDLCGRLIKHPRRIGLMTITALFFGWGVYGLWSSSWSVWMHGWGEATFLTATNMVNYPRVYDKFLRFFAWQWPFVTASAAAAGGFAIYRWIQRRDNSSVLYLSLVVAVCTLMLGTATSIYESPRYSYHLYPAILILTAVFLDGAGTWLSHFTCSRMSLSQSPTLSSGLRFAIYTVVVLFLGVGVNTDINIAEARGIATRQYGDSILHPLKTPSTNFTFRQDLKTPALYVKEHLQPGDKIVHITPASDQFYIGRVHHFLREKSALSRINSVEAFRDLITEKPRTRFWLVSDSIFLNDPWQFSDKFRCFMKLLEPQIVYTGLDSQTHVYLLTSADMGKIDESQCAIFNGK